MKVLMLNGSPKASGNTYLALHEMEKVFAEEGIETELIHVGNKDIRGCIACTKCFETGKCVFNDIVNEIGEKFKECDGLVVGSPVYYASANATLIALLTRLFYIFYDFRYACSFRTILEQHPWPHSGRSRQRSGRPSVHAHTGKKYVFSHKEHPSWERSLWPS